MPLLDGSSDDVISANIAELIRAGHSREQAAAIAYRKAGRSHGGMHKAIVFLKGHVAGYTRKNGTYVPQHEDRRQRRQAVFRDDMKRQAAWLDERAREHGFGSIADLLGKNPELFGKLAERWRAEHPQMAKAMDDLLTTHVPWKRHDEPTPAQAEAGNYRKPVVRWNGLDIAIENPAGTVRRGNGWQTRMVYDYGYVKRSEAVDGDEVDVYLGPNLDAPMVYVVHQRKYGDWDAYDEDKVMAGFDSEDDARAAYLQHYDDPRFLGPITAMPVAEFVEKVRATHDKPAMIKGIDMTKIVLFMKAAGAPPPPGKVVKEGGEDKIVENLDGLISEHEHLVGVLEKDRDPAAQREAREEAGELKGFKRKKKVADKGASMAKAVVLMKAEKLSDNMRARIGTVGSKKRADEPEDAFLEPGSRKYPVKVKTDGKWAYSPKLLEAAAARARMQGRDDLAKHADEIRAQL